MVRPCYLVVDREFPGSISTRKLVIETAKFNVLTAYSAREAIEMLRVFPAVSGVVVDEDIDDIPCHALVGALREFQPLVNVIVISGPSGRECPGANYHLDSFDPRKLLGIMAALHPKETKEIATRDEELDKLRGGPKTEPGEGDSGR
ncbi:response regulator [Silvibacterium sp.]|uniref:response regulator n=1 Tax=Silvibacterium sp. TaxID=1964179 RepID=UPI0039E7032E